jgi:hypothetical protein
MPGILPEGLRGLTARCLNHAMPEAPATAIHCGLSRKNFARVSCCIGNEKAALENRESPVQMGLAPESEQRKSKGRM